MPTTDITEATFEETVSRDGIVLVDWWASWCGSSTWTRSEPRSPAR